MKWRLKMSAGASDVLRWTAFSNNKKSNFGRGRPGWRPQRGTCESAFPLNRLQDRYENKQTETTTPGEEWLRAWPESTIQWEEVSAELTKKGKLIMNVSQSDNVFCMSKCDVFGWIITEKENHDLTSHTRILPYELLNMHFSFESVPGLTFT